MMRQSWKEIGQILDPERVFLTTMLSQREARERIRREIYPNQATRSTKLLLREFCPSGTLRGEISGFRVRLYIGRLGSNSFRRILIARILEGTDGGAVVEGQLLWSKNLKKVFVVWISIAAIMVFSNWTVLAILLMEDNWSAIEALLIPSLIIVGLVLTGLTFFKNGIASANRDRDLLIQDLSRCLATGK